MKIREAIKPSQCQRRGLEEFMQRIIKDERWVRGQRRRDEGAGYLAYRADGNKMAGRSAFQKLSELAAVFNLLRQIARRLSFDPEKLKRPAIFFNFTATIEDRLPIGRMAGAQTDRFRSLSQS